MARELPAAWRAHAPKKTAALLGDCFFSVGEHLSSRAVTSQVFSARTSLTSVFGMETGGPSSYQHQLFAFVRLTGQLHYNTTSLPGLQALFRDFYTSSILPHIVRLCENTARFALTSRPDRPAAWPPAPFSAGRGICFSSWRMSWAGVFTAAVTPSAGQALFTTGRSMRRTAPLMRPSSQKIRGPDDGDLLPGEGRSWGRNTRCAPRTAG